VKLAYARIVSNDVSRLAEFYRQLTGISPVGNEDYVAFETAGGTLALSSERAVALYNAGAAVSLEFEVSDVDRERARLSTIVREFVLEPIDQPWGNRSMLFRDPDGNLINFFAPIRRESNRSEAAFPQGDDH
jgi:catechol 2,3-dioxygenase-like lactoylglutathione lyase family enzyme